MVRKIVKKLKVNDDGEKYKTKKKRLAKIGGVTHKKEILNRDINTAGQNILFDLESKRFIDPSSTMSNLRKKYIKKGYEFNNNIGGILKFERVGQLRQQFNRRLNKATFDLKNDVNLPKSLFEFYNEIVKSRIMLFTNDEIDEHIYKYKEGKQIKKEYLNNNYVTLRFVDNDNIYSFRSARLNKYLNFKNDIANIVRGVSVAGSDAIAEESDLKLDWFQLFYIKKNRGGGEKGKKSVKSKWYFNENYDTKDNNCLIGCVKLFKKDKRQIKSLRKLLNDEIKEGEKIKIEDIAKVEEIFNVSDDRYDDYLYGDDEKKMKVLLN